MSEAISAFINGSDNSENSFEKNFSFQPNSNGFSKIFFEGQSNLAGLSVLLNSRVDFVCVEDGYIVESLHKDLLSKANVPFEVVKK